MDQLHIQGGKPLQGKIKISGAKNAALPELCAALLTDEAVSLTEIPSLQDVQTMATLLQHMGMQIQVLSPSHWQLRALAIERPEAPYELVKTMRAAILVLGPLLSRYGHARVSLPGGCAIGSRPVDQHIKGLQAMGALIHVEQGYIQASLPASKTRLQGAKITTDMVTVTGTENLMMAACLAQGETHLENAAQEPEIIDLANMLIAMGARIEGHGTRHIHIQGVDRLHAAQHQVLADRIEAGTYLCAAAVAGGDVWLENACAAHLEVVIEKLQEAGVHIQANDQGIHIKSAGAHWLKAQSFRTTEYPGFPTDMQAQFMALNAVAQGASAVTETIFENRYMHVPELQRLGAHIQVQGRTAMIEGAAVLSGAHVKATDLRASASLVIAALVAQGQTVVDHIYHLDRGYDQMEEKLQQLGAQIKRVH